MSEEEIGIIEQSAVKMSGVEVVKFDKKDFLTEINFSTYLF